MAPGLALASVAAVQAAAVALDLNTIIMAVIGLMGSYLTMRVATLAAAAKEQKAAQDVAAASMREIHTAVNSGKTILENKLDALTSQNAELVKKVAILEENKRGAELAKAVASAPPGMVVLPAVSPVSPVVIQAAPAAVAAPTPAPEATQQIAAIASAVEVAASAPTRMGEAIVELKAAAEETSIAADKTVELVDKQHPKPSKTK